MYAIYIIVERHTDVMFVAYSVFYRFFLIFA